MQSDYLMLSGIQHFAFCRRQWALIHVEQQWVENGRTVDGNLFHRNAHNDVKTEKRGNLIITRGLRVFSDELKITGICDVVEFHRNDAGIKINCWDDLWQPYPVEYKKGKPKEHDADELQLCAQAICLEEMLCCKIEEGSLFYGETKRRQIVKFDETMKQHVFKITAEMWNYFVRGHTPKVKPSKSCNACSLKEICLPRLLKHKNVDKYIADSLEGKM